MINENFHLKNLDLSFTQNRSSEPRHGWYFYKEGFSSEMVHAAIESANIEKKDLIIDPFNGSGTTTLSASILGLNSVGIEVNPFTAFLSSTKSLNCKTEEVDKLIDTAVRGIKNKSVSPLLNYSTFSENGNNTKWLFNRSVLNSFEGGWQSVQSRNGSESANHLLRLALIKAAMDNSNARKDGKCLRYKANWYDMKFDSQSFLNSFITTINRIRDDIGKVHVPNKSKIYNADIREAGRILSKHNKYKLCITSPPYLNTFDYTDIYRPELFLGKFVKSNTELRKLRLKTVRSHLQVDWPKPSNQKLGAILAGVMHFLKSNTDALMSKKIPLMVQAYFEDMFNILLLLRKRSNNDGQLWLTVSNSAYANKEIPVDLILSEIGTLAGWNLKEIGVLRYLKKRKSKHSKDILELRESLIILQAGRN